MWYGSAHLTRPISELNESVKGISRGDFNRKIPRKPYPNDTAKYHNELDQLSACESDGGGTWKDG